ncbi:hypothetical protein MC885_013309 [Smutsia gigantea]|nr:hypothetical protein MC885_013309 [Smutsia gigantea]
MLLSVFLVSPDLFEFLNSQNDFKGIRGSPISLSPKNFPTEEGCPDHPAAAEMESKAQNLFSEDCRVAVNYIASYELHVSDAYLSMACYYNEEEAGVPHFAAFFEDQAEVKREYAKQFLRYLRRHQGKICLPVIKRPDIDNWGTSIQAIESALQLEITLNKLLQDLKSLASEKRETDVSS